MSLRARLLALFGALAIVPLLATGVFEYVRSIRALEALIEAQTALVAQRSADEVARRYAGLQADVALLAQNAEVGHLYGGVRDRAAAVRFLSDVWASIGRDYAFVAYRDNDGVELYRLGAGGETAVGAEQIALRGAYRMIDTVVDAETGRRLGTVEAAVLLDSLLPRSSLDATFGRSGSSLALDASQGKVLRQSGPEPDTVALRALFGAVHQTASADTRAPSAASRVLFRDGDSTKLGALARVPGTPLVIAALGNVEEFSPPFARIRDADLAIVLTTTVLVAIAFLLLMWRATRSLASLTLAADEVGRGNLHPSLPPAGRDEVGRLSSAFALMLERVRTTMAEIERSRQMAVVGEFAAQISHEIRNPLTAIKLNLQKLERAVRDGLVPREQARPVEISLREIQRLDRVVRAVLRLGRPDRANPQAFVLADAIAAVVDGQRAALDSQHVSVVVDDDAPGIRVLGDRALVEAAFANLITNAAEAMPEGGTVNVTVDAAERNGSLAVRIRVADTGPGVAPEHRDQIFSPFFSTKPEGTGLGLALAVRTIEEHQGRMTLDRSTECGAAFIIELPASAT